MIYRLGARSLGINDAVQTISRKVAMKILLRGLEFNKALYWPVVEMHE